MTGLAPPQLFPRDLVQPFYIFRLLPSVNKNTNYYDQPPDLVPKIININQKIKIPKTNGTIFYDKEKFPPPLSIPFGNHWQISFNRSKAKGVLGINWWRLHFHPTHWTHYTKMLNCLQQADSLPWLVTSSV